MEEEFIKSRQNPRVKLLIKLQDRAGRRRTGLFAVEGLRELSRCVKEGLADEIYFCPEMFKTEEHAQFVDKIRAERKIPLCRLSEQAFERVSNREGCDGLMGIAKQWGNALSDIVLPRDTPACILVADAIEKPGNLGAIMRTADSLGAHALILTNPVCDIFNPAAIRASQGAFFALQTATATVEEAADWLAKHNIKSYGAHLKAAKAVWDADLKAPCAIVMGSEKSGLAADWEARLFQKVIIPMNSHGISDSMNVNVAAALCLYEVLRQRNNA